MSKITTLRGRQIDINALRETFGATVALGNAHMNARGDIIGTGGEIVKSKEQVVSDYYNNNPKAVTVTSVSLKDIGDEVMAMTPAEAVAAIEKPKDAAKAAPKRRIRESED